MRCSPLTLLVLLALGLGQAILTVFLTVVVFGSGMARFGTGEPEPADVQIAGAVVGILAYPWFRSSASCP